MIFFKRQKDLEQKRQKDFEPEIQIMMVGARRVGKTSLLASMYNCTKDIFAKTNITCIKEGGKAITDASEYMKNIFRGDQVRENEILTLDSGQTQGFDKIDFILRVEDKGKKTKKIRFLDCSGEWFNNRTNEEEIGYEIEKSEVIMIVVDSVLLMEENGKHQSQNAADSVCDQITFYVNPEKRENKKKMIIFVPTKCEKYFRKNADASSANYNRIMTRLGERIKENYKDLFTFFEKPGNQKYFTVCILPVITMGGVEFFHYTEDTRNNIDSSKIQFNYCKPLKYAPMYCDRPLIYSLLFYSNKLKDNYYQKAFKNGEIKVSARIGEWFQKKMRITNDKDFISGIERAINYSGGLDYPGKMMIQDPDYMDSYLKIHFEGEE